MRRLLLTGATGLTGSHLLPLLLERWPEAHVFCTVRASSAGARLNHPRVSYVSCDVEDASQIDEAVRQTWPLDGVIHLVQLRLAPLVLDALAAHSPAPRLVVVGTTGVFSRYQAYSEAYRAAEADLAARGGPYVLLRPTMIYGSPRDQNLHKLIRFIDRFGCFPRFGTGGGKMQPVFYQDLAEAIVAVLDRPELGGRAYTVSGATVIEYRALLRLVAALMGRPFVPLPIPIALGRLIGRAAEAIGRRLPVRIPFREEQVLRLLEDKHFDHADAARDFGFAPRTLEDGLRREIQDMRDEGLIRARRGE